MYCPIVHMFNIENDNEKSNLQYSTTYTNTIWNSNQTPIVLLLLWLNLYSDNWYYKV